MTVEAVRPNPRVPWPGPMTSQMGDPAGGSPRSCTWRSPGWPGSFQQQFKSLFKVSDAGNSLVVQHLGVWSSVLSPHQVQVQSEGWGSGDTRGTQGRHSLPGCDDPARLLFCRGHSKGIAQPSPRLPWAQLCPRKSSQSQCGLLGFQDTSLGPPGRPALFFEWSGLFLVSKPRLKGTPSPLRKHGPVRSQQAVSGSRPDGAQAAGCHSSHKCDHCPLLSLGCIQSQNQQAGREGLSREPVPELQLTRAVVSSVRT